MRVYDYQLKTFFALKISDGSSQIDREEKILQGCVGVPKLIFYGKTEKGQKALVTTPVGESLHSFWNERKLISNKELMWNIEKLKCYLGNL